MEFQYLWILLKLVVKRIFTGYNQDRTGVGRTPLFGQSIKIHMKNMRLPVLRSKSIYLRGVLNELVGFINGRTSLRWFNQNGVRFWNGNGYAHYKKTDHYKKSEWSEEKFLEQVMTNDPFSEAYGTLGDVYGAQWRDFLGVDQLQYVVDMVKAGDHSTRLLVNAWRPDLVDKMALPPCHVLWQVNVEGDKLHMDMYQRSADWFLGVPFNITSYALLLLMLCELSGLKPGVFRISFGNAHLYGNHLKPAIKQLLRWPFTFLKKMPYVLFTPKVENIEGFSEENVHFFGYKSFKRIKAEMAV